MSESICEKCVHRNVCRFYESGEECGACNQFIDEFRFNILPCKVGETVWVANLTRQQVFLNKVYGIYIAGTSKHGNIMRLEHTNQFGEKSYRKYTWAQFGKTVFLTREEAEAALAERMKEDG